MGHRLHVMTILGTRPEIIRLSCIIPLLDQYANHTLVHTGQNYDYELNEIFFSDLQVRKPDYFLGVDPGSLGTVLGSLFIAIEKVFQQEQPEAVLLLGDTNSALTAIMARRMKIPIYHMEAGNRCFDLNVPEEINRRIIDHISDFNLVYTEHARRHLLAEGIPARRIYLTGSPMREVLNAHMDNIQASTILNQLELTEQQYFIASLHREENVDHPAHLTSLLETLERIHAAYHLPIIVSTHPRTRKRLEALAPDLQAADIRFLKPFGFVDYIHLQMRALCVISDSGTISEESAILKFPAITVRNAMERPEALDTGTILLTGLDPDTILQAIEIAICERYALRNAPIPREYEVENVSQRVIRLIIGAARLSHLWDGILLNDPARRV